MKIADYIDHTILKPNATLTQIKHLCGEAKEYNFYSVCVNPCWVPLCKRELHGTSVKICAVIGFPLGANQKWIKRQEAETAIIDGADELDMVMNIGLLMGCNNVAVYKDIKDVTQVAHTNNIPVKVIIETVFLTDTHKILACQIATDADADFVKTCTGFNGGQATVADIQLMKKSVDGHAQIKASGGIRDYATALAMIEAGADRIGTSSGVKIVQEEREALAKE